MTAYTLESAPDPSLNNEYGRTLPFLHNSVTSIHGVKSLAHSTLFSLRQAHICSDLFIQPCLPLHSILHNEDICSTYTCEADADTTSSKCKWRQQWQWCRFRRNLRFFYFSFLDHYSFRSSIVEMNINNSSSRFNFCNENYTARDKYAGTVLIIN